MANKEPTVTITIARYDAMEARIDELQAELDSLKNDPMTKKHYNQIIADGIEEMFNELNIEPIKAMSVYIAKLREGDDG